MLLQELVCECTFHEQEEKNYRRRIHSDLKILASLNALPEHYRKQVHRSQIHRYRKVNPTHYVGHDLSEVLSKELEFIRQIGDFPTFKKISVSILKMFVFFRSVFKKSKGFNKTIEKQKYFFVELSQRFRNYIPATTFSKLIGIHESTLRNWTTEVRVKCSDSLINLCRRVHPNQLLISEANEMKTLLTDARFQYWPLISVYYYSIRNNKCSMALSTWYKYARLFNLKRLKPRSVKNYGISVKAMFPNQYWHADVTKFRTIDGTWNYIYTVIDNFSKFPLSVLVSNKLSGEIRMQSFRDALKYSIELSPNDKTINLVVDGGSENFNGTVTDFLKTLNEIKIHRIRALRDVVFSNSIAEAFNRILKIYYLNQQQIPDTSSLIRIVEKNVNDFSFTRPHGKLNGLTPYEAITGVTNDKEKIKVQVDLLRRLRIEMNSKYNCSECNFG
jgi:putative transposase